MSTDVERLIVRLEATQRQFERQLQSANRTANRSARQIETRFQRTNQTVSAQMTAMATTVQRAFGAIGIGFGAAAIIRQVRSIVAETAEMARVAERVGLTTDALQELRYGFEQVGISAGTFDTNMERFGRRMGTAATSGGRLADILEANGVALRDANGQIRDSHSLLRDFAELIRNAGSEQERLVLAQEAFGIGGRAMIDVLRGGADAIDGISDAAQDAGVVIREELIERAQEFDDRWSQAMSRFSAYGKSAALEVLGVLQQLDGVAERIIRMLPAVQLGEWLWGNDSGSGELPVDTALRRLEDRRAALLEHVGRFREGTEAYEQAASALRAVDQQIGQLNQRMGPNAPGAGGGTSQPTQLGEITVIPERSSGGGGRGRAGSRDRAAEAALREAQAVLDLIEALEFERDQIGLSSIEQRTNEALRRAGAAATDEQRGKIRDLIAEIERETEALRAAEDAARFFGRTMESAMMNAIPKIETGNRVLDDLLNTLIRVAAQAALLGTGPLSGLFGGGGGLLSLFPFAQGGIAANGRPQPMKTFARGGVSREAAIFGETSRPEAAVPLPDGRRIPVDLKMPEMPGRRMELQEVIVSGVFVDDGGVIKARVDTMGRQAAQAGAAMGARQVASNMDALVADTQMRKL